MTAPNPAQSGPRQRETRTVVDNRQARHLYFIEDTFEAGLMLRGWEVKAILAGQATFNGGSAFIRLKDGEAFVESLTITPLAQARKGLLEELEPTRPRQLLLNKAELRKLERRVDERGYTVVPLALTYTRKLKLNIGLAKGKKLHDKRDTVRQRDQQRDLARELKAA
ncbi:MULTISPECIES: SsrA-binding protein SmpB [unclassified Variovorax]|uniref:SsrA-binding protein SmpB n=1 Tax=unclassified Variovorax TaxID=663243 RepID=UPI0009FCB251|nr:MULTISPECIES: SsrA-binding protein SmpB [unclassified Variovorax]PNG50389.1 SsrA-binding protein [Variovorax sp. B2]PNG51262.1 SsrA-binding protein [Variovorax sp. B4]VTU43428.1 Small protein B [Variovorax sp. PBL-H6]VTV17507.1 SsrA-binding protein [Variovorax sp. WDL1]